MPRPTLSVEQFIAKSKNYHGDNVFDYSKVKFSNNSEKFTIKCLNKGHEIQHSLKIHFKNSKGCPICNREGSGKKIGKSNSLGLEEFKRRSIKMHGEKFDLSEVVYVNTRTKVKIICIKHGPQFIGPRHHLKGSGCYECGRESCSTASTKYKNLEVLLEDLRKVHGDRYDYSLLEDKPYRSFDKIPVICKHHGLKPQMLRSHLNGNNCNECRFFGYTKLDFLRYCENNNIKNIFLYLLKMTNYPEVFYKVGITARSVQERFKRPRDLNGYEYTEEFLCSLPYNLAWDLENEVKEKYKSFSHKPRKRFTGYTECFTANLPVQEVIDFINQQVIEF